MSRANGDLPLTTPADFSFKRRYGLTKREYFEAMILQGFCELNSRVAVERAERALKELDK